MDWLIALTADEPLIKMGLLLDGTAEKVAEDVANRRQLQSMPFEFSRVEKREVITKHLSE